jgi:hypothetical protein
MASARAELARALRWGNHETAIFLLARMEKVPRALRDALALCAREALLCETHDAAPNTAGSFDSFYKRRQAAKDALVNEMYRVILHKENPEARGE